MITKKEGALLFVVAFLAISLYFENSDKRKLQALIEKPESISWNGEKIDTPKGFTWHAWSLADQPYSRLEKDGQEKAGSLYFSSEKLFMRSVFELVRSKETCAKFEQSCAFFEHTESNGQKGIACSAIVIPKIGSNKTPDHVLVRFYSDNLPEILVYQGRPDSYAIYKPVIASALSSVDRTINFEQVDCFKNYDKVGSQPDTDKGQ